MLPGPAVPPSLLTLLQVARPCFTAPSFRTFAALVTGLIVQQRRRTVVGMLLGAGLTRLWPHDRAHYFFAKARWSPDQLGLALARLIVERLLPEDAALDVAVDDTLFKQRGRNVYGAAWQHDGCATGAKKTGFGNNWVVLGLLMPLPYLHRPVCLPAHPGPAVAPERRDEQSGAGPRDDRHAPGGLSRTTVPHRGRLSSHTRAGAATDSPYIAPSRYEGNLRARVVSGW
ncbi:transposase, IS4 [Candidatus Protofrankia californiensis]|uniref:Transposase, IS4 n=1 Tax=Candidatus Protofrankia californiensis TaxID=1839754 RepID=A0A1C3P004_9ACTN|nr:transposase, IS4 [Candidatus Protofrankia californiensis]